MSGEKNLKKLIASMTPILTENEYVFGTLDAYSAEVLAVLNPISTFQEKEGLTVVVQKEIAEAHNLAFSGVFRCITLRVHSSLDAVGLTAAVATKLTQANISANVIAAYYHDHVFIASTDAETALSKLKELACEGSDI
ncbi:ACT domain-containing protein [Glaciecola sp. SC05]|uniref:ACT domain-containing protein n=1 Tax=Glaciecola sp. SC05 TaxID=1987355 RepID=UPI003528E2E3